MKAHSVFSVLFVVILTVGIHGDEDDWSVEEENCVNELKLDKPKILTLSNKNITPYSDSDFNKFLTCYWKKKGAQEENGKIIWEKVDQILEEDFRKTSADWPALTTLAVGLVTENAVVECKTAYKQGDDHGENVAKFLNCISTKIQEALKENNENKN